MSASSGQRKGWTDPSITNKYSLGRTESGPVGEGMYGKLVRVAVGQVSASPPPLPSPFDWQDRVAQKNYLQLSDATKIYRHENNATKFY